jgi:hypothetical protein
MSDECLYIRNDLHQQPENSPHLTDAKCVWPARTGNLPYSRDAVLFELDEDFPRKITARSIDLEDATRWIESILAKNAPFRRLSKRQACSIVHGQNLTGLDVTPLVQARAPGVFPCPLTAIEFHGLTASREEGRDGRP